MKIIYKKGSLVDCEEQVIIHGCNEQGVMGAGVAKAIREAYPKAFQHYVHEFKHYGLWLGKIVWVKCVKKGWENYRGIPAYVTIGNAITQRFYGRDKQRYVNYDAVRTVMSEVNSHVSRYMRLPNECVAMPKIGAGLAGGDWNIIEKIIEEETTNVQPVVYYL